MYYKHKKMNSQSFYVLLLLTFSVTISFKWNTSLVRKKFSILNSNNENDNSFYNDIEDIFKNISTSDKFFYVDDNVALLQRLCQPI